MKLSLTELLALTQKRTENVFRHYLQETTQPSPLLQEAMAYSLLNGGKRLRPLLVYATGLALNADLDSVDAAACALEMMHAYSLIHDDLPAMDDADLRRGKPACHIKYGEAMAILAGDALQTLAFQVLLTHPATLSSEQRLAMLQCLCAASGADGMAGGQALDILNQHESLPTLTAMQALKTGALFRASIQLGFLAAPQSDPTIQAHLEKFAAQFGEAFQIQDDLLDAEGNTEELGKPAGLDVKNKKITFPLLQGLEETKKRLQEKWDMALASLAEIGEKAYLLKELVLYLQQRKS